MNARLKDFGALAQALAARELDRAAARERERERAHAAEAEHRERHEAQQLFAQAVGPIHLLRDRGHAHLHLHRPRPAPVPRQRELDEQAALLASLSDEVDHESLLLTDDGLSYRRPGVGPDVTTRLRRGQWTIQAHIDLHGLRRDEAREALSEFLHDAHRQGRRCVRIVHGKGHGSPGRQPVLKAKVQRWLAQSAEVVAFAQASGPQGGAGALIVLLAG